MIKIFVLCVGINAVSRVPIINNCIGRYSGHVHAYPNPSGHTLKVYRHLDREFVMKMNERRVPRGPG